MKSLSGGIDIGSEHHHVIIMGDEERILYDQKVSHKFSEFHRAVKEFREIEEREGGKVSFAIEGKNGYGAPFDRILIENGFTLYNVDNLKLKRFRDVFGAEWRNDQRDAKMLAKMLRLRDYLDTEDEKAFITVEKASEVNERLKILSRHQQVLIDEKVRIQNRLRKRLLEVCPDILEVGDVDSKKMLRLLAKYPDFSSYKRLTMRALLKIEMIGEIGDINRFKTERQLAVYCGVACVDNISGKQKMTKVVYKANKICKATMIEIAGCTIRYVSESSTYYAKKRAEGKKHNHALRCLARQMIKVIFKMLKEDRDYIVKEDIEKAA